MFGFNLLAIEALQGFAFHSSQPLRAFFFETGVSHVCLNTSGSNVRATCGQFCVHLGPTDQSIASSSCVLLIHWKFSHNIKFQDLVKACVFSFGILAEDSAAEAMASNSQVQQEVADLISPNSTLGINVRLQKVLTILEECGLLYTKQIAPSAFLCHPQNRGGSMCNGHNCHKKGGDIHKAGVKKDLLPANSLAIEISLESRVRELQVAANRKMITDAKGLLADLKGDEQFLTLANSHFIQWAKAMDCGCKGPDGSQLVVTPDMKPLLMTG